ncbi:MAG: hypothetical protein AB1555_06350 [Nitrospirota bacterium]
MKPKGGFKNMPKRQARKFAKLKVKNVQQQIKKQATRLHGARPTDERR